MIGPRSDREYLKEGILKKSSILIVLLFLFILLFWMAYIKNTATVDWFYTYYPATKAFIEGRSPYENNPYFFTPVWALIPIIPYVIFPYDVGRALFFVISILGFFYLAYKAGGKPIGVLGFLLSAPVTNCIQTGNIEWIPLLGIFLPAPIGIILLSMKPQSTIGVIFFIFWNELRKSPLNALIAILPSGLLFIVSWLIYGPWFLKSSSIYKAGGSFIVSAWPVGIPIGLGLLWLAFRRKEILLSLASSPLLSPYAVLLTWCGFLLSFIRSTKWMLLVSIGSWIFWWLFRLLRG